MKLLFGLLLLSLSALADEVFPLATLHNFEGGTLQVQLVTSDKHKIKYIRFLDKNNPLLSKDATVEELEASMPLYAYQDIVMASISINKEEFSKSSGGVLSFNYIPVALFTDEPYMVNHAKFKLMRVGKDWALLNDRNKIISDIWVRANENFAGIIGVRILSSSN